MITLTIDHFDNATEAMNRMWSGIAGSDRTEINAVGGRAANEAARAYHREFDSGGGWRGTRSFGTGGSSFGAEVTSGWNLEEAAPDGATITNDAAHLSHKVTGGTITPKRASALTIPLIQEARGVRASEYERNNNTKLFRPKGKNVLMESIGNGEVRSVYALVKSVTQKPWPGALPPDELIADAFAEGHIDALEDRIETKA